jgi:hypothetical protein
MRIISGFHDYYDSVQAMGQDQSLLYIRNEREEFVKSKDYPFPYMYDSPSVYQYTIGFCGKIYPAIHTCYWFDSTRPDPNVWCYTLEDVDQFVESHFKKKEVEAYHTRQRRHRLRGRRAYLVRDDVKELFDEFEAKKENYQEMFIKERCPVIVGRYHSSHLGSPCQMIFNATLREYEFFRVVEPYTAFQEIQMFMSNLAVPLNPIPEISDKIMVDIKGFDKWSFRKMPKDKK